MSRILLILVATIFLSSFSGCGNNEVKPFEDYEYNVELTKTESPDNRELFEVKCFKRKYRVWLDLIGAKEKFAEAPVNECSKLFGYQAKAKANLWALMEYARKEANTCIERQESFNGAATEPVLPGASER